MKHRMFFCLVLPVVVLASLSAPVHSSVDSSPEKGFRKLFNGKNLDGWYTFMQKHGHDSDPDKIITIEDDMIHLYKHAKHGDEVMMGYIGTNEDYGDYHFRVQYKWGDKKFAPRFKL
ncbi:MAG: DUF1080 domain-containing protein, partial [Planctomycetales bacterium]